MKLREVPTDLRSSRESNPIFTIDTYDVQLFPESADNSDPSKRGWKAVSYFVLWDEEFFKTFGIDDGVFLSNKKYGASKEDKYAELGILAWAWLNPDGSTPICYSLIDMGKDKILNNNNRTIIMPLVDAYNYQEHISNSIIDSTVLLSQIYSKYPEIKPLDVAKEWVRTKIMPEECKDKLFGVAPISSKW